MPKRVSALILGATAVLIHAGIGTGWQASGKAAGQQDNTSVLGTWRGESKCLVVPSSCHDEQAVYHITAGPSQTKLRVSGNKIVDGKEINMGGDGECTYEPATAVIDCALPGGNSIHLQAKGSSIEGKMTLADGTPWRKITLHKTEQK